MECARKVLIVEAETVKALMAEAETAKALMAEARGRGIEYRGRSSR